jgi:hypothetical protein
MKLALGTALLVLLASVPGYAQQSEPDKEKDKAKPAQKEDTKRPDSQRQQPDQKPQSHQPQDKDKRDSQQQDTKTQEPQRQQEHANKTDQKQQEQADKAHQKQEQEAAKQQQQLDKDRAKQDRAAQARAQQDQHTAQQAQRDSGNRNVRRIRDEDFHARFGSHHHFHVHPGGDLRFHNSGYWFELSEPWPAGWSYGDDVYVQDFDDNYYLVDPLHPEIRVLVYVVG